MSNPRRPVGIYKVDDVNIVYYDEPDPQGQSQAHIPEHLQTTSSIKSHRHRYHEPSTSSQAARPSRQTYNHHQLPEPEPRQQGFFGEMINKYIPPTSKEHRTRAGFIRQEERLYGISQTAQIGASKPSLPHAGPSNYKSGREVEQARVHQQEEDIIPQLQQLQLDLAQNADHGEPQDDEYDANGRSTAPELNEKQQKIVQKLPYDVPEPAGSVVFDEGNYAGVGDSGPPQPYELPLFHDFNHDLRIVKRHKAGCYGATGIIEVLHNSSKSVTSRWYRRVEVGERIIAKRITACDRIRARSWKTESDALKRLSYAEGSPRTISKIIGRLAPSRHDPFGHIFTEYCSLGDVGEIMAKYMEKKTFIPEAFVWQLALDMGKALLFLNRGITNRQENGVPGWRPIIHNDIKMNNIFMKPRPTGWNNIYPLFVLGDFGLCSSEGEPAPPSCASFMSPQRLKSYDEPAPSDHKDDIYAFGVTLFLLVNGFFPFEDSGHPLPPLNFDRRIDHRNPYREGFCRVINRCTSRDPKTRPSARELIGLILGLIEAKGWSREGSRQRLWPVSWLPKSRVIGWRDQKEGVRI
ncbi:hypothetical protein TWF718_003352 [Orbilia javanica]|uniref:non-specific serine/threonine protein kinase n=1 Tax=Orbilia javanica TaxID=47235 RepID=A0AAN8RIZ6_9PEZI